MPFWDGQRRASCDHLLIVGGLLIICLQRRPALPSFPPPLLSTCLLPPSPRV